MNSREAYDVICDAVEGDAAKRVVDKFYDDDNFGSFVVSFEEDGSRRSVVNDRGFVFLADGLDGSGNSTATVPSLYDVDAERLLSSLNL
jgi:hypothetical protein